MTPEKVRALRVAAKLLREFHGSSPEATYCAGYLERIASGLDQQRVREAEARAAEDRRRVPERSIMGTAAEQLLEAGAHSRFNSEQPQPRSSWPYTEKGAREGRSK